MKNQPIKVYLQRRGSTTTLNSNPQFLVTPGVGATAHPHFHIALEHYPDVRRPHAPPWAGPNWTAAVAFARDPASRPIESGGLRRVSGLGTLEDAKNEAVELVKKYTGIDIVIADETEAYISENHRKGALERTDVEFKRAKVVLGPPVGELEQRAFTIQTTGEPKHNDIVLVKGKAMLDGAVVTEVAAAQSALKRLDTLDKREGIQADATWSMAVKSALGHFQGLKEEVFWLAWLISEYRKYGTKS